MKKLNLCAMALLSGLCLFGCGNNETEPVDEKPYSHIESVFNEFETIMKIMTKLELTILLIL